jgi:hypothetical protein
MNEGVPSHFYLPLFVDRFESGCFANNVDAFPVTQTTNQKIGSIQQMKTNVFFSFFRKIKKMETHLAICERVSKSRLFMDVLTSRHPIYCKYLKEKIKSPTMDVARVRAE